MSIRYLSIRTVVERTSLSRSEIYRRIQAGTFPRQTSLGGRRVAWAEEAVELWAQALIT